MPVWLAIPFQVQLAPTVFELRQFAPQSFGHKRHLAGQFHNFSFDRSRYQKRFNRGREPLVQGIPLQPEGIGVLATIIKDKNVEILFSQRRHDLFVAGKRDEFRQASTQRRVRRVNGGD